MMSFYLSGGVEVLGFISPTEPTDEYPVIDPLYGIDGFRNVNTLSELNSIPNLRRRAGMVVGISGGTQYYKLNPQPWNGTITDWDTFSLGGGTFTGGTVTGDTIFTQGVTATTFSASTYLGLPLDIFVTGGTYSNGTLTFTNNSGGTFNVFGLYTGGTDFYVTGGTFNKNTETLNLNRNDGNNVQITGFTDIFTTGFTFNPSTYNISIERNDGVTLTQNLGILATDVTITGGTYDPLNGSITFVNNTGGTFTISGFITGFTDIQVTGYTYQDNTFTISDSSGNTFSATIDVMTGLTINGDLTVTGTTSLQGFSATTISATTIGTSGDCVDDIYVSNIHSCSPLNINPLDEGNVYFGSTSGVTIDLTNNRVGIGTSLPQETLHISGTSRFDNDVTIWDDGVFNGNSRKLYFRGLGQTGNTQTGQIFLDAYGNTNGEILELRSGGGVRLGATDIDGTIQVYNFASNNPVIQSVQTGGLGFNVNSTTNGFAFYQGYAQTTGDLFSIYNSGPTKAFSILASNSNVGIGNITPQYKLDISGETRSRDRIYAGVFTPGTMLQPTDYFATTGRIVAGGGINFRSPIFNDNTWTGFGFGGFDTTGISIKIRNGEIGSFGGYGADTNPYLYFGGFFNPISGSTSKSFIRLNPTYSTPNDLSYTGGIRGFLYDPVLTSISGISFHRAIETTTGDVIFGSTSGNVGIGTLTPTAKLDIVGGNVALNNNALLLGPSLGNTVLRTINGGNDLQLFNNNATGNLLLNSASKITFGQNGTPANWWATFFNTGNLVIQSGGTHVDAGYRLDVIGDTRISGKTTTTNLQVTSGATTGYVLTSDASGNATWQSVPTFTGGTVNGLTATTISATTYYNLPTDVYVTGGTYSNGTTTFTNNTGGTFNVTGYYTGSTGVFGISNSGGTYTYYSTLSLAMSAATAGQTIEMFADFIETSAVTITLKNGVNINGNGHTYTLDTTTTTTGFIDGGVAVSMLFSNITLIRKGSGAGIMIGLSVSGNRLVGNSAFIKIESNSSTGIGTYANVFSGYVNGFTITCTGTSCSGINLIRGYVDSCNVISTGTAIAINIGTITNSYGESTGSGHGLSAVNQGYVSNCSGKSNTGYGINAGIPIYNSVGYSSGNYGIVFTAAALYNCTGISAANYGIWGYGETINNCVSISSGSNSLFLQNAQANNCTAYSSVSSAVNMFNSTTVHNSTLRTLAGAATVITSAASTYASLKNCTIINDWNNSGGHGVPANSILNVLNCVIKVTNSSANCLYSASPVTMKYANNVFEGSNTPVNANITQGITNTQDNYGNILI